MNIDKVPVGRDVPDSVNVIIEIPALSTPVKYELDKESGALFVDRFLSTQTMGLFPIPWQTMATQRMYWW